MSKMYNDIEQILKETNKLLVTISNHIHAVFEEFKKFNEMSAKLSGLISPDAKKAQDLMQSDDKKKNN